MLNKGGGLRGTYLVRFPRRIDEFRTVESDIRNGLLEYIQSTHDLRSAPEKTVFQLSSSQFCSIRKLHDESDKIVWAGVYGGKSELEASIEIYLKKPLHAKFASSKELGGPRFFYFTMYTIGLPLKTITPANLDSQPCYLLSI